eukprot:5070977-Ditylum_brightwellii.AAC.1
MGFHSFNLHPFYIVPSAPIFTHPCTVLSQDTQQQTPPSTAPVWHLNQVFWTSKTQQNMPSLCKLPIQGHL